jgi:hypothetical protein
VSAGQKKEAGREAAGLQSDDAVEADLTRPGED